jgi:hypothetical protein
MSEVKLNIIYNNAEFLNGYDNISPVVLENKEIIVGNVYNLDWIVDNGECIEIIALDTIEYLPITQYEQAISNWVSKLKVGGTLILGFVEIIELFKGYDRGIINYEDFNVLLHGKQTDNRLVKLSSYSAPILIEKLTTQHTIKLKKHTLSGIDVTLSFGRYK